MHAPNMIGPLGVGMQLELDHVVSLHLAGGILEEQPAVAAAIAQLFGALRAHLSNEELGTRAGLGLPACGSSLPCILRESASHGDFTAFHR